MNKYPHSKGKGFTLIELLVVIAIIGILASVVLVSLGAAKGKAADVKIISDIKQIRSELESNFDGSSYPDLTNDSPVYTGFVADGNPGTTTINALISDMNSQGSEIVVVNAPSDPSTFVTGYALYGRLVSSSTMYVCMDSTGKTNLEASDNTTSVCP
ncbi:MAG: type II secretion system protein [Candidatus Paceibacterota bacterium]|jgi:prepilin-type N-terminal cleavage/methylation domain-containing protein